MSTDRIPKKAGHVNAARLPRGPNGLPLCRCGCGRETPGMRRTFASDACVHEWRLTTDPSYQAKHVFARDKGVCQSCGIDCVALQAELLELYRDEMVELLPMPVRPANRTYSAYRSQFHPKNGVSGIAKRYVARCDELGITGHSRRAMQRRLWEMDHVVPVVEGGGGCSLDNLRTLCWACHRRETAKLAARRAMARRKQQEMF